MAKEIPEVGIGLAMSGGGYRAMLFHLGGLWRLQELDLLKAIDRFSSVSGGAITSAKLGLEWDRIGSTSDFKERVVGPIRSLASKTIDRGSIIGGVLFSGSAADRISSHYAERLFGSATLQDLPDQPRFIFNATNVETGLLWRFSKPYMGEYSIGRVSNPSVSLADAVTASSAFPPVLSPFILDVEPDEFDLADGVELDPFRSEIMLTDGGVYDNLGLETVVKRYQTVLVSDAGGAISRDHSPASDWARHTRRVLDIIHAQAASQRKRRLIEMMQAGAREGAYWGIGTNIAHFELSDAFPVPVQRSTELAQTRTRLRRMGAKLQDRIINWGYAVSDASIRRHWKLDAAKPSSLPYPESGI
ncbi:MAG: patatin-like phospholipase family protein [Pseudomonadota bacterium]